MKSILKPIIFLLLIVLTFSFGKIQAQSRTKVNFGFDWEFKREEKAASNWEKITIPHTAKIEPLVVNNQFQGTSWYQKKFKVGNFKNKKVFLYFEGVMQEADVWINDQKVTNHKGGYLPFTVDATPFLKAKKDNIIKVKVNNEDNPEFLPGKPLKDLDFNYYGGIYRNVYLITTDKLYITNAVQADKKASGGIYVNFDDVNKNKVSGAVQVHLKNEFAVAKDISLKFILTNKEGEKLEFKSEVFTIKTNSDKSITQKIVVKNPKLWSISNPNLYHLEVQVISNNKIIDSYSEKVGIRKSEIKDDGYYLNDEKLYITGTNEHQEYPYLGYAISDEAQYRDAVKIKNAGLDFVRLSHYPHAEAFLNACDELGILVMNSLTGWQFFGNETFQKNAIQDIRDMARRDRNHPSIIFWEASLNETEMSESFMNEAAKALKEELPFPHNYSACWIDNPNYDIFIPARQHGKAPDYWTKYNKGNRKIFIAEYGDWEYYAQNAGFNQTEFANLKEDERTSRQLRSNGEKRLLQQAYNFQEAANSNRKGAQTIGEANWVMFDYNRGYSNDLESSGISDIFRIPKFAYHFYQSQRDATITLDKKLVFGPMVHIANYWTSDSPLNVTVYSNCDEVVLYLNDVLVGKQKPTINQNSDELKHAPFVFKVEKFIAGTLRAEGFVKGEKVVSNVVKTPESAAKIALSYDVSSKAINPNFPDMVFIYAKITDENGTVIPDATNEVTFALSEGDAELIGENPVKAEAGIATIILKTPSLKKSIKITSSSERLQNGTLTISNNE
ncbi:glycoside hydrolase family 2 TIM barrel-domain containing protein [Flavobacterium gawalongense]|uniref:Glycoside hydrolase family 2 protein n=1 Tax=Flavobacterium gawalongense TaxID=2594432 RepID=A0A553BMN6_9FLAO|nr:glycoside hydrolase family 2 TIM barrel-domain containing protein [Flavobacterium gawalongense]TRX09513.1 glycoside hydrolase family 2 protein [Flavobacterium gawalongense]TRX10680.1 glycoside hydrolase family 2 protein [Flavobacterium gawalongense]TRX27868.1 glycoside hydrolase family 2 protein [Flavobacterium gawalongense]